MEVEFSLNRNEYAEFLKLAYARMNRIGEGNTKFFTLNILVWVFIGMGLTGIFRFYETYEGLDLKHLNLALAYLSVSVIGLLGMALYRRKFYLHYALSDEGHMLKEQKVKFTKDGIEISTRGTVQSFSWESIQGKEYSKNLVCLYIDNSQALIVPKRAFSGEGKLSEVCELIDSKARSNNQVK